jgi:hypothetical protein
MSTTPFNKTKNRLALFALAGLFVALSVSSCKKDEQDEHHANYSSEVLDKWLTLQLRLMRNATGIPNQAFSRHFAYAGIAALEAIAPGMPAQQKWSGKWNGLTGLPEVHQPHKFYYPANLNAALAGINRSFFPNASGTDKAAIDSLEQALYAGFEQVKPKKDLEASAAFGHAVAAAVYHWAETDGYKNASAPYVVPTGPGLWVPTPTTFAPPATPYWGNNRTVITGSTSGAELPPPTTYATATNSPFYQMVKQVYDASQTLTNDQKAMAIFWRDVPGATSPGHWVSILQQLIRQTKANQLKAVLAYALTGAALNDALIACFKVKYQYNLLRPVTYIRDVMGHTQWNSFIGTPAHPEYSSAHASLSTAAAVVLEKIFGNVGSFTDSTYNYLSMPARTYGSILAVGEEASLSRFYAGIHYLPSIEAGKQQGKKVADNILQSSVK